MKQSLVSVNCENRKKKKFSLSYIEILEERCRNCSMCIPYCPEKAIFRQGNKCVIDRELCNDCGECLSVCPVKAIKKTSFIKRFFARKAKAK